MKTIVMMILGLLVIQPAVAQKKDVREKEVPAVVLQALLKKYPEAKTRTWKTKNGEYEVDFYKGSKKFEAKFEGDGAWKKTSFKVSEKDVPDAVRAAFRRSEQASWQVDDYYNVEDADAGILWMVKAVKGQETMELYYRPDGDLFKAKSK
jgi:hypothetical protein